MKSEEEEEGGDEEDGGGGQEKGGIQSGFTISKHQLVCTVRPAPPAPRPPEAPPTPAHLATGGAGRHQAGQLTLMLSR